MSIEFITTSALISDIVQQDKTKETAIAEYILPFTENTSFLISNVKTKAGLLAWNGNFLPFSVNTTELDSSYVCSPYTAYISYAMQEMYKVKNRTLQWFYRKILPRFDGYLTRRWVNKNIHINNWLLATNLYPNWLSNCNLSCLVGSAINNYPDHAIILRSLNEHSNKQLINNLLSHDFLLVPSRQIYIQDLTLNDYRKRRDVKRDLSLLRNTPYRFVPESELTGEYDRIVDLYNQLYLQKYSKYNPHFTEKFIENLLRNPFFKVEGYKNAAGELDAVSSYFQIGNTMSIPIVGYEMQRPLTDGLYRLLIISSMKYALTNGLTINASSGAPDFKRHRGGQPFIEYSAVYTRHLPRFRQRMWLLLETILTNIVVPMMKKYQL